MVVGIGYSLDMPLERLELGEDLCVDHYMSCLNWAKRDAITGACG
jgi:hypothetical protein